MVRGEGKEKRGKKKRVLKRSNNVEVEVEDRGEGEKKKGNVDLLWVDIIMELMEEREK